MNYYLSAADHFTLMHDHELKKNGLPGNYCLAMLQFEHDIDSSMLAAKIENFITAHPYCQSKLKRNKRRYYWELVDSAMPFFEAEVTDIQQALQAIMMSHSENVLEFHLLSQQETLFLAMRWYHPLCDAKGAELILHAVFTQQWDKTQSLLSIKKNSLIKCLLSSYKIYRYVKNLSTQGSSLPLSTLDTTSEFRYQLLQFDKLQTKQIMSNARFATGLTGTALYFLGCIMRALDQLGCAYSSDGFCVPYAVNTRKAGAMTPIFGNQVSFLFNQASHATIKNRKKLFATLLEQNKLTVKNNLDKHFKSLMEISQYLSLNNYARKVRLGKNNNERSSFWFSYTGDSSRVLNKLGYPIKQFFQLSPVTSPPGVAFLVNSFNQQLTISLCFLSNMTDEDWVKMLCKIISRELLNHDEQFNS